MKLLIDIDKTEAMDLIIENSRITTLLKELGHKRVGISTLSAGDNISLQLLITEGIKAKTNHNTKEETIQHWNDLCLLFNI